MFLKFLKFIWKSCQFVQQLEPSSTINKKYSIPDWLENLAQKVYIGFTTNGSCCIITLWHTKYWSWLIIYKKLHIKALFCFNFMVWLSKLETTILCTIFWDKPRIQANWDPKLWYLFLPTFWAPVPEMYFCREDWALGCFSMQF